MNVSVFRLIFGALLMSLSVNIFSQELFIVHPHKYYLDRNTNEENKKFIESLTRINDFFCQDEKDVYWVFDNKGEWLNREFPIQRCGAKKLRSEWGVIDHHNYKYKIENKVVLTGLYFNQCVSRAYLSILKKFMNTDNMKDIEFHFPLSAMVIWSDVWDYPSEVISSLLKSKKTFLDPYQQDFTEYEPFYNSEIYNNGILEREYKKADLKYGAKTVRLYFWTNDKMMFEKLQK